MRKILVLMVLAAVLLTGCASGKFLGFLATTDYVDNKAKEQAATLKAQADEIAKLKEKLADYESLKAQAQAAIDQMNQSSKIIAELQNVAQRAEERIAAIPREVIKQIADILQASLSK